MNKRNIGICMVICIEIYVTVQPGLRIYCADRMKVLHKKRHPLRNNVKLKYPKNKIFIQTRDVRCKKYTSFQPYLQLPLSIKFRFVILGQLAGCPVILQAPYFHTACVVTTDYMKT